MFKVQIPIKHSSLGTAIVELGNRVIYHAIIFFIDTNVIAVQRMEESGIAVKQNNNTLH